jgi:TetR/AcrR family transcriptional regulator, transcriptional repressor of aconitase
MPAVRLSTDQRRRSILEAALPLFARKGFAATTTKDLAAAAGISEALLYRHFPSKEALYREILRVGAREIDPFLARLKSLEPSTSSLVHLVHLMVHRLTSDPGDAVVPWEIKHRLLFHSHLDDGEFARLVFDYISKTVQPVFESCLRAAEAAGDVAATPVEPANRFWFVQQLTSVIACSRLSGKAFPYLGDPAEVRRQVIEFMLRGIGLKGRAIKAHYNPEALDLVAR